MLTRQFRPLQVILKYVQPDQLRLKLREIQDEIAAAVMNREFKLLQLLAEKLDDEDFIVKLMFPVIPCYPESDILMIMNELQVVPLFQACFLQNALSYARGPSRLTVASLATKLDIGLIYQEKPQVLRDLIRVIWEVLDQEQRVQFMNTKFCQHLQVYQIDIGSFESLMPQSLLCDPTRLKNARKEPQEFELPPALRQKPDQDQD
jgi:hypothetical protein